MPSPEVLVPRPPDVDAGTPRVLLVVGSGRSGRTGSRVGQWTADRLARALSYEVPCVYTSDLGLADLPGELLSERERRLLDRTSRLLAWATSVVVVTPEYNRSFPASLKTFIDAHREEWVATPTAFVSYGGISRGLRAVEQLGSVLGELHAVPVRDGVPLDPAQAAALDVDADHGGAEAGFSRMVDHLLWWDAALTAAVRSSPYPSSMAVGRRRSG